MECVCVSESFLSPLVSESAILLIYYSESLFTSLFCLVRLCFFVLFLFWKKTGNIFLNYLSRGRELMTAGWIFSLSLPNNVFLYRPELLLTLPLVQRCINGS